MSEDAAEKAVRDYLNFLEDPSSAIDQKALNAAEKRVASATDPIDKLRAHADVERLKAVDGSDYRQAFTKNAKPWAEANGIIVESFQYMKVPDADLRAAGFSIKRGTGTATRTTGKRVSQDEVIEFALGMGTFTVEGLREKCCTSSATAVKAKNTMEASGAIEDLGADPDHTGPGRRPTLYKVVKT